ncbi:DUF2236 domain-containing protein [Nocardia uniformis]|uniref:DUF2236 domain-containing protein n=1 Tax=Nocardia uniformis TaxID=53432 RepID=A0A849BXT5_9NOCA|nr:oxygenase MpaB family protein [Nocardia uniformis]NNH71373.1 DUF2236 domain-containing protein [Nocardia uniformis]
MTSASERAAATAVFRRGGPPVAAGTSIGPDGQPDYGYFGPATVVWRVLTHPAVPSMIAQVTGLLEVAEAGLFSAVFDHDPLTRATLRGRVRPSMVNDRLRRTVGVPVPIILGDKHTADRVAAHLRRFHSRMQGTIPATGEPYDAAGSDLVVFAHVTIMHAALLVYERTAFEGGLPRRLDDEDRDRYFAEAARFGELMGARPEDIPRSVAQVHEYYRNHAPQYYRRGGDEPVLVGTLLAIVRMLRHPGDVDTALIMLVLMASGIAAFGIVPGPVRRLYGIPKVADPLVATAFRLTQPLYALLAIPPIGDRVNTYVAGPDAVSLARSARQLMHRAHSPRHLWRAAS